MLPPTRRPSRRVMAALGYVAPDPLPPRYLLDSAADPSLASDMVGDAEEQVEAAWLALHAYSLVDVDEDTVNAHRVVQAAARRACTADAAGFTVRVLRAQTAGVATIHVNCVSRDVAANHLGSGDLAGDVVHGDIE